MLLETFGDSEIKAHIVLTLLNEQRVLPWARPLSQSTHSRSRSYVVVPPSCSQIMRRSLLCVQIANESHMCKVSWKFCFLPNTFDEKSNIFFCRPAKFLFSSAGEVNKHHSAFMVKKDPGQREIKTFIAEEGALFFGCVLFDRHHTTPPSVVWCRIQDVVSLTIKRQVV